MKRIAEAWLPEAGSKSGRHSEWDSVYGGVRGFLRGGGEKRGRLGMLDTSSTSHGHTRFTFRRCGTASNHHDLSNCS